MTDKALEEKNIRVVDKNGKKEYYLGDAKLQRVEDNGKGSRVYYHPDGMRYYFPIYDAPSEAKCWLSENKDGVYTFYNTQNGEVSYISDKYLEESNIWGNFVYDDHRNRVYTLSNGKQYYFNNEIYPNIGNGRAWLVKDGEGTYTYYDTRSGKMSYTLDKDGNEVHYKENGRTVDYTKDKKGNRVKYEGDIIGVHFKKGSNLVDYTTDKDGNEVHYESDGKTIAYTKDKDGKTEYYKEGIRNNMLAENRKKLATKVGLGNFPLPKWMREAEERVSREVEKMVQNKKTEAQKTARKTNNLGKQKSKPGNELG